MRRRSERGERGLSESVQWAVLTPLLILLVIGLIQGGIKLHGQIVAQQAAAAGAEAAALSGADPGGGEVVARRVAAGLEGVVVSTVVTTTTVTVTVSGRARTFLDVGQGAVSATASHPREPR